MQRRQGLMAAASSLGAAAARVIRHVQSDVLPGPGDAARRMAGVDPGSTVLLLAREDILHEGPR
ncbi:MAG: hypothetical protein IT500_17655 [Rubrivivax sp.]|nr:hypothetical protein [Rubrivivax sp.]